MRPALVLLAFVLAACGTDSAPDTASSDSATEADTPTEIASAETGETCLVGTWQIDPASMDLDKVEGMDQVPDAEFSIGASTGRALLVFEPGGEAVQRFEDFSVTVNAEVMGMTMSVQNNYSGTASATYRVEGDRLVMEPGEANLSATLRVNEGAAEPNPFATESIFETWERGRSTFACEGDLLSFDIRDPSDDTVFIRDVRYTRVAG
ncbi:MAG: hypothetical protein AAF791_04595 [Bacteroidota bacterium]